MPNDPLPVVGIIANPASGKDVRRLVAFATTVDNQGKVGIIRRVLVGLSALGIPKVVAMPENYHLCDRAQEGLGRLGAQQPEVEILDLPITDQTDDSTRAADHMRRHGVGCIITLGGDGTVRAVSKGAGDVPLVPISTGTNNVLPAFVEGTLAGMAAGAVATGQVPLAKVAQRHNYIEVRVNGEVADRALVDLAVLSGVFIGSRAIWSIDDLREMAVTRADAASIGISAIVGALRAIAPDGQEGLYLSIGPGKTRVRAAIAPGLIQEVSISGVRTLHLDQEMPLSAERPLVLALDGEREIVLYRQDQGSFILRARGPWIVDVERTMRLLAQSGFLAEGTVRAGS